MILNLKSQVFNSTESMNEREDQRSTNLKEPKWTPVFPINMSEPFVIEDERTRKPKTVREWNGNIYEPMAAWIDEIDQFGLMKIKFKQEFKN